MILLTVPHSGESLPTEASWLKGIPADVLLTDVDRFIDDLYGHAAKQLDLTMIVAGFHRYAVDLNRLPTDIDATTVEGSSATQDSRFVSGIHWRQTTKGHLLMPVPISQSTHRQLIEKYFDKFHSEVKKAEELIISKYGLPRYHLDLHSMPSQGTAAHKDNGAKRPDIVVSDCEGRASSQEFKDAVIDAYTKCGFEVSYNWPYKGGRMTETYGAPAHQKNSLQIELNRKLYMDETTKKKSMDYEITKQRLAKALESIHRWVRESKGHC
jgi:N-formylglutamate amidohydrolase